jgi:hypothetical protein
MLARKRLQGRLKHFRRLQNDQEIQLQLDPYQ